MQGFAGWTAGGAPASGGPGGLDSDGYRHKVGTGEQRPTGCMKEGVAHGSAKRWHNTVESHHLSLGQLPERAFTLE